MAITKTGQACGAWATEGGLCFFHANPNKASELGRIGGRKNRRAIAATEPLPNLNDAACCGELLERLGRDLLAGRLHPRVVLAFTNLLNTYLRTRDYFEVQPQFLELRKRIDDIESRRQSGR
jgi:hypothetical protein